MGWKVAGNIIIVLAIAFPTLVALDGAACLFGLTEVRQVHIVSEEERWGVQPHIGEPSSIESIDLRHGYYTDSAGKRWKTLLISDSLEVGTTVTAYGTLFDPPWTETKVSFVSRGQGAFFMFCGILLALVAVIGRKWLDNPDLKQPKDQDR
ncbi:hypothetical protein [Allorhizocola rhizosphaerae]|uniref:hypothetical protein n=1 Tax=Allorhizocola rhizosphaerae TaxID=1872709 RepID=UPI0013C2E74E|nr:hypothetical protein [Allorhizocola rhizosphaerae]